MININSKKCKEPICIEITNYDNTKDKLPKFWENHAI